MNTWTAGLTGEGVDELQRNSTSRATVSHRCLNEEPDDGDPPALAASRAIAQGPAPVSLKTKPAAKHAAKPKRSIRHKPATPGSLLSIEIEDGIPIPRLGTGRDGYPFRKLEVGQSFFIPRAKSMTSVNRANKTLAPMEFTSRKSEKDGVPGYRVWRVK